MENCTSLIVRNLDNVFLIDWLSVTFHGVRVEDVISILGMYQASWFTDRTFINGYPLDTCCGHIHIRHGADDPRFYDDPSKARSNMGISLDMSGQGCREFESYSTKSWFDFITDIFRCGGVLGATCNVTRLDLAYDDHSGLLNIWQLRRDVEDRNYISKSKKSMIIWSDDQMTDIRGVTLMIGSKKSDVLIRIYDKAAERGFSVEKHWIRVELQLRHDRSTMALRRLYQHESIGLVASGILCNYCTFVSPSCDSNKARWPIADYWARVLEGMEKIRLWSSPGEEYNLSKSEQQLTHQYGQLLQVIYQVSGRTLDDLYRQCRNQHPVLKPKYQRVLAKHRAEMYQARLEARELQQQIDRLSAELGFSVAEPDFCGFGECIQTNFAELMVSDPDCPWR